MKSQQEHDSRPSDYGSGRAGAVVIGRFQSAQDEVNLDIAEKQLGFDVVRRCTGGGAMFIEPGNTSTYSLCAARLLSGRKHRRILEAL